MSRPVQHFGKWRIRWIDEAGKRQSEVYDRFEDAAFALERHRVAVQEVRRGLRLGTPPKKTVGDLCDYWLANRAPHKRSRKDDESIIRRHLRPSLGGLLLGNLGTIHFDRFVSERAHLDKKTVHNHVTLLKTMLNVAVDLGWLQRVPRLKKPKVRRFSKNYRFLKTRAEIARFLEAAALESDLCFSLYATAIYTGMREGEIAALRWEDVDFEHRLITVQRSFDGPTKADDVRHLPILDPLLPVLQAWRARSTSLDLVFPNEVGAMYGKSGRIFQEVLHRVLDRAKFPRGNNAKGGVRWHVTFHSLRHTFASHWMMDGGCIFRLQSLMGHKSIEMTQRYAHLRKDIFATDYSRMGGPLVQIPGPATGQPPLE